MGMLKQYRSGAWESRARGGGSGGSSPTAFATNLFATMSGNQNVTDGAWIKITFDTAGTDDNSEWDAANTRWTCLVDGVYLLHATLRWTANSSGMRGVCAYLNTAILDKTVNSYWNNGSTITTRAATCIPLELVIGDDIEIYGYHNSTTSPLAVVASGCSWSMHRLK